nr:NAD(P)H-hydrate epimerase [Treponemataceae bacterium]
MKSIYNNPAELEKSAKEKYCFPEYIMMENAASAMEIVVDSVAQDCGEKIGKVLIVCGGGNNGADGLALARRLNSKYDIQVLLLAQPKTDEGKTQYLMAQKVGVKICSDFSANLTCADDKNASCAGDKNASCADLTCADQSCSGTTFATGTSIIVDCIFGTGFHGKLPDDISKLIEQLNSCPNAIRIACDISSGLKFNSDITVTMGSLKTSLFSDEAKNASGKIFIAD